MEPMSPSPETPVSPLAQLQPVDLDLSAFANLFNKPEPLGIAECIENNDFLGLKSIGMEQGFGSMSDNRQRAKCYSILLGCGNLNDLSESDQICPNDDNSDSENEFELDLTLNIESESDLEGLPSTQPTLSPRNSFSKLIHRDLERNGYSRWTQTAQVSSSKKQLDLSLIVKMTDDVFTEHGELNYIQGMDSVFALFYVLCGGNVARAKRMIVSYLFIFRNDLALNPGRFGDIHSIWKLLRKYDKSLYRRLLNVVGGEEHVAFALEWYISWFCHSSIVDLNIVLRLFDFAISTQCQNIGLYLVTAVLLEHKQEIKSITTLTDFVVFCGGGGEVERDGDDDTQRMSFDMDSIKRVIERARRIMESEQREVQRRNWLKSQKKEVRKTFLKFRRKSKALGVMIDDLVKNGSG